MRARELAEQDVGLLGAGIEAAIIKAAVSRIGENGPALLAGGARI